MNYKKVNQFRLWNEKNVLISSHVQWDEIVIKVEKYDEDLSILGFNDQIDDSSSWIKIIENAKIVKIIDDHQTRTSVASQKASRSRSLKLELNKSDNSSDFDTFNASSEHLKWVIAKSVNYRTLNDL